MWASAINPRLDAALARALADSPRARALTRELAGRSVEVRVNDRGPHRKGRIVDLSRRAAEALGMIGPGLARVRIEVLALP